MSASIQWVVTEIAEEQLYYVLYGTDQGNLQSLDPVTSTGTGEQSYSALLQNLLEGTTYYVQIVSEFGEYTLTSETITFTTLEPGM